MDDDKLYRLAQKKVKRKKGFYRHLQIYVLVNFAITMIVMMEGSLGENFPMPLLWGVALAFHYCAVFGMPGGKMTDEWEDRELEKEYHRIKERYGTIEKRSGRKKRTFAMKEEFDLDDHLDLKEPRKVKNYDEGDFV